MVFYPLHSKLEVRVLDDVRVLDADRTKER